MRIPCGGGVDPTHDHQATVRGEFRDTTVVSANRTQAGEATRAVGRKFIECAIDTK